MPRKKNAIAKIGGDVVTFAEGGPVKVNQRSPRPNTNQGVSARGPPELLTVAEAAQTLRVSKSCLDKWRVQGVGPRFVYVGRHVRYALADIAAYVRASTRSSTSQQAAVPP